MYGIEKSVLLISKSGTEANIRHMADKVKAKGLNFRPHFKTHQSYETAGIFKKHGIEKIAVSNIDMAYHFMNAGFKDICLAIPFNPLQAYHLKNLSSKSRFCITIDSPQHLDLYNEHCTNSTDVMIKIDTGYHRTGVNSGNTSEIMDIIKKINWQSRLHFKGFLVHNGQTYQAASRKEIANIHMDSLQKLQILKSRFSEFSPYISIGDTPSASICEEFGPVDELRPGNFVYYDYMQYQLGACRLDDIACHVIAPVISVHPDRREVILHCGAVHLSKESLYSNGHLHFGEAMRISREGEIQTFSPPAFVTKLSQEHGTVRFSGQEAETFLPGDLLAIIPVHSCLTVNLMKHNSLYID
ncbi:MAG: alanine racemase [Bacteroidota bacterium]